MSNMENNYNFYIKKLEDNSVWGVVAIDTTEENRLGWINCVCLNVGSNIDIYLGSDVSGLCVVALSRNLKLTTTLARAITQNPCYVPFLFEI